jgi:hypothetical protein
MSEALKSYQDASPISARHFVSFYQQPHFPIEVVCDYLAEGLDAGETAVAVVTSEHADSITNELITRGLPLAKLATDGIFACPDAGSALVHLLDPRISKREKDAMMSQWIEESLERAPARRCRFLGEIVSLMVARGSVSDALDLEDSWNQLLATYPAMLYCTYEQTPFESSSALNKFCDICNLHEEVLAANLRSKSEEQPSAWFVLLQEQTSSLREEVMRRRRAERLVFINEANRLKQLETLLRVHGPYLTPFEKNDIVKVVSELQAQARKERRAAHPESSDWHKKAGEILGYEKVIASVMRAGRKLTDDPGVS